MIKSYKTYNFKNNIIQNRNKDWEHIYNKYLIILTTAVNNFDEAESNYRKKLYSE